MNGLAIYQRLAWGRRVLGTFVVACLAIALQPCAMAAEVEHDCPHCPPVEDRELSACDVVVPPDCAADDQLSSEPRSPQLKVKDTPSDLPVALATAMATAAPPVPLDQPLPRSAVFLSPGGPPRNVLYCVYLK